jgi:hypothetical protein
MFDNEQKRTVGSVDMSEKARENDITMPVVLSDSLVRKLQPGQFLIDLGISFEKRLSNLFELVRANLEPSGKGKANKKSFTIPLVIVNGPLVREDVLSTVVRLQTNGNGEETIFITDLRETNDEYED